MTVKTMSVATNIYTSGQNPINGESCIRVELTDSGAGAYFTINDSAGNTIDIELDELIVAAQAAGVMLGRYEQETGG